MNRWLKAVIFAAFAVAILGAPIDNAGQPPLPERSCLGQAHELDRSGEPGGASLQIIGTLDYGSLSCSGEARTCAY